MYAEPRAKRVSTAQVEKYGGCLQRRNAHQQQALQPAGSVRSFWVMREQLLVEASQRDYSLASWLLRTLHASRESSCQPTSNGKQGPALLLHLLRILQLPYLATICSLDVQAPQPGLPGYLLQGK